jgi:hypothetical protein
MIGGVCEIQLKLGRRLNGYKGWAAAWLKLRAISHNTA